MRALALWLSLATAFAAVDGTVQNRTTGKPQAGAMVLLFKLGQAGPEMLASTKSDAEGRFSFAQAVEGEPHLIEAAHEGVTYNLMLPPGTPAANLEVEVFDSSKQPGHASLVQHMVLLEPTGQQLSVSETFLFNNDGNLTYHDPAHGTLRFFVPEAAKDSLKVMAQAPQGMPVERAAEPAGQPGVYKLNFAIKPGETRIDVIYAMPLSGPGRFPARCSTRGVPTQLVVPNGVGLDGEGTRAPGHRSRLAGRIYRRSTKRRATGIEHWGRESTRAASNRIDADPALQGLRSRCPGSWPRLSLALALGFILLYRRGEQRG